jgi:hypothetical protein
MSLLCDEPTARSTDEIPKLKAEYVIMRCVIKSTVHLRERWRNEVYLLFI